jgi:DNA replicative helicase MCM subunit Mcm2 (Cdc46/Mcm family)
MPDPLIGGVFDSIEEFISTAEGVVSTGQDLDEANTKAKILTPLVRTLGWPVHDNDEVLLEYSGDGQFDDRVDYALFDADGLYAVIEAKQIGQQLSEYDSQIRRYMRLYGPEWGLLTNGESYRIYQSDDDADESLVESLSLASLSTSEYLHHLSRENARNGHEAPAPTDSLSDEQKDRIIELSNEPDLYEKVVGSVAPAVYGYETEKLALAFALVGGVDKPGGSARPVSGAIDVLIVHHPDTQVSDLTEATKHLAPDSAYFSDSALKVDSKPREDKSLIATENPIYDRFSQYEPIGEQLPADPDALSSFDLIFTITDQPDEESDRNLARHLIEANRAGELHVRDANNLDDRGEELREAASRFEPPIDRDLLSAYIAYARSNCSPTMTGEAQSAIEDFYVDLRAEGQGADSPVPVSTDFIDTLVRLTEASARLRLSATVDEEDVERAVDIAHYALKQIGVDPRTGEYDADVVETGQSKTQRDRVKTVKGIIEEIDNESDEYDRYGKGAPVEEVLDRAEEAGIDADKAEHEIEKLKEKGEAFTPRSDYIVLI